MGILKINYFSWEEVNAGGISLDWAIIETIYFLVHLVNSKMITVFSTNFFFRGVLLNQRENDLI